VSFLEIQFLAEIGRLTVRNPEFMNAVMSDARFTVDDIPLTSLVRHALRLEWTRDPFDRLLVAHSSARRTAFCTTDRGIRDHHRLLPAEFEEK
jgi:PIN domain nuclease of toxin-antitoxin system